MYENNYRCKHFVIEELISQDLYTKYGSEKCWEFLDPELLKMIDIIKERFPDGTCSINTWKWNGDRKWSGIRTSKSSYFSVGSMHSWGKAVDMVFSKYTADEVREDIIANPDIYYAIKGLELGISWVHIDTRNRETIKSFYP